MCQAIVKPFDVQMFRKPLANAWSRNPDGGGYSYTDGEGNIQTVKGFTSFVDFWKSFREHQHQNVLIHFRFATHGDNCAENTHPFTVGKNIVMAHNGVLWDYLPGKDDKRSDSRIFAEDVLEPTIADLADPMEFINVATFNLLKMIVKTNKLVFLTPKGFYIINEDLGTWHMGIWWSSGVPSTGWVTRVTQTVGNWMTGEGECEYDFSDVPDQGYSRYQRAQARKSATMSDLEDEAMKVSEDAYVAEYEKTKDIDRADLAADIAFDSYLTTFRERDTDAVTKSSPASEVIDADVMSQVAFVPVKYRLGSVLSIEDYEERLAQRKLDMAANHELMRNIVERSGD